MGRISAVVSGAIALALGLAACGGGGDTTITSTAASTTTSTISEQDLQNARREGAQQAHLQAKLHHLRQQVNKASGDSTTTVQATTPPPSPSGTSTVGNADCGGELTTGPHTSCPFAQNVRRTYFAQGGGNITITAFSPVTGQSYTMTCVLGDGIVGCTGPQGIAAYFPPGGE